VTFLGIVLNGFLLLLKLAVGMVTGSVSLIADAVHSLSDLASDLVVLGGIRLGSRKADATHPYGHGRFETLAGGIVAASLIGVGVYIVWEAGKAISLHEHSNPGWPVLAVAGFSILAKEWIYRRTIRIARQVGSAALFANAWHHRSDALSSVAVLSGAVAGLIGWEHADQAAGVVVGLMVAASGGKTLSGVVHELTEGSLGMDECDPIKASIEKVPNVRGWHQFRTRRVGRETFVDVHVLVLPDLSLVEAHRVSMLVEEAIRESCGYPVNIMVHVEPDTPDLADHHDEEEGGDGP
jgi:cation diffusion facilitator family transporter